MLTAAARNLVRQPSFFLAAVGTLALGIAAPTAIFSTVNAVLLEPLPYSRPQDIYTVRTFFPSGRFTIGLMASEEMTALAGLNDAVARTAIVQRSDAALVTDVGGQQVVAFFVSGGFFDLFGVPMARGRAVTPADAVEGAPQVAVLSHALWRSVYGGREDIIGRPITLANRQVRVVGVAPEAFDVPTGTDVWISAWIRETIGHGYEGFVRLKPGVRPPAIAARLQQIMDALGRKYPDQELGRAYALRPLLNATVGDLGPILLILFAATALLLVLATANVSNLVLVRSTSRAREFAIRAALGAGRARIVRLLVTESLLLSVCGGVAGIAAAYASVRLLMRYGGSRLPRLDTLTFDAKVVGFVVALVALTALMVGLLPAIRIADTDIAALMNESGRGVRGSRKTRRLLGLFVVAEIAVAVALVAGAARLVRSYDHLQHIDPGFDPRARLVLDVVVPATYSTQERRNAWWQATELALRNAGAVRVASASSLPLQTERDSTTFIDLVSRPDIPPEKRLNGRRRLVSPDFFRLMGITQLAGRPFTEADGPAAQGVAIVNQAFVRRSLGDLNPIGERIKDLRFRRVDGKFVSEEVTIVGVVADVQYASLTEPAEPIVYLPCAQYLSGREIFVVTTADGRPEQHASQFRAALRDVDRNVAVEIGTLAGSVASSLDRQRLGMWLMSGFGVAALLLAMVGVFGVVAYVVSQRTGEMAVRQALGATRAQVIQIVLLESARTAALGTGGGLVIALWMGQLVTRYVYGVRTADPLVLGGSVGAVLLVVACATIVPASRAAAAELSRALRQG